MYVYVLYTIFQCEFNGSVHFTIRLTIFGNSFVVYVCICVIHHFSVRIQWQCSFYDQTNHIWQFLCFICMYICYTPFFSVNSAIKSYYVIWRLYSRNIWYGHHQALFFISHPVVIIMSSGDYVIIILRVPNLLGIRSLTRPKSFTLDVGTPWDIKKLTVRTKSLPWDSYFVV